MIYRPGIAVGQMSGSLGGVTASRNKGGQFFRLRAIPTNPSTTAQLRARGNLATVSEDWQLLTSANRDAWTEWARQNPIVNALGDSILMSGHQSFVKLGSRRLLDQNQPSSSPPVDARPNGYIQIVQDGDIGAGDTDLTFSSTLPAGGKVELWGAVLNSPGIEYVKNLYKFIAFSAVDQASPWDNQSDIENVLGTLAVGQTLHITAAVFDPSNGQRSTFLKSRVLITTT